MKIVYKGSLQRTMIIYFLMISFASFLIAAEFTYDTHSEELRTELTQSFERLHNGEIKPEAAFRPIESLRDKATLMVALFLVVVLILLTMFIKNITEPLQHMIETSKLIAAGDLSQTVTIRARNELSEMGNTVNDLTSNLQEMILLSGDMCKAVDEFTGELSDVLSSRTMDQEKVEGLKQKVHLINSKTKLMGYIIQNCKFYGMGR